MESIYNPTGIVYNRNAMIKIILLTFLNAMVPVLELRTAIPLGVAGGLSLWAALVIAIAGNMVPIPFILLFIRRIFAWMQEKNQRFRDIVARMEAKAAAKQDTIHRYEWWGLVILVAIPLPGTGAWTGALVAALMDMQLKRALPAIFLGICIAGIIVSTITYGVAALV